MWGVSIYDRTYVLVWKVWCDCICSIYSSGKVGWKMGPGLKTKYSTY